MKMIVTGASGSIGSRLVESFRHQGYQVIPLGYQNAENIISLDLCRRDTLLQLLHNHSPDFIVHLAGIKDLRYCEAHPEKSYRTNFQITETLVEFCHQTNTSLVYFSTDYVFGHANTIRKEDDPVCPNTQYGKDKALSESIIIRSLHDYAIIRTAQVYGFPGDFVSLVKDTLCNQEIFSAFSNLVNCPTHILDLQNMVHKIIEGKKKGIFHCVGQEAISRYDFAINVARALNLNSNFIRPCKLDFKVDSRPSVVNLSAKQTYQQLSYYPKDMLSHLKTSKYLYLSQQ